MVVSIIARLDIVDCKNPQCDAGNFRFRGHQDAVSVPLIIERLDAGDHDTKPGFSADGDCLRLRLLRNDRLQITVCGKKADNWQGEEQRNNRPLFLLLFYGNNDVV